MGSSRGVSPALVLVTAAVLALAGCSASIKTDRSGDARNDSSESAPASETDSVSPTDTFDRPAVPFVFSYLSKYELEPGTGKILGVVRIGDYEEISVRKNSDQGFLRDTFLPQFESQFEDQGIDVTVLPNEVHSDIDMAIFDMQVPEGTKGFEPVGGPLRIASYFFVVDGKLWQMQCPARPSGESEVRKACDLALGSIKPK